MKQQDIPANYGIKRSVENAAWCNSATDITGLVNLFGNDKGWTAASARQFALQAAEFEERISKLEIVHEGEDEDQLINEMEARGEIPPAEDFPAGRIRVIVHRIVDPPKRDE